MLNPDDVIDAIGDSPIEGFRCTGQRREDVECSGTMVKATTDGHFTLAFERPDTLQAFVLISRDTPVPLAVEMVARNLRNLASDYPPVRL